MNHDYCHCGNNTCPLRSTCRRYALYVEDKCGNGPGWCSYADFRPDESGKCEDYLPEPSPR